MLMGVGLDKNNAIISDFDIASKEHDSVGLI